jgi:hypothetical protein
MQLSQKAINDFKKIYFMEVGKRISDNQANEMGSKLLNFFKLIYKPIPKKNYATHKKIK